MISRGAGVIRFGLTLTSSVSQGLRVIFARGRVGSGWPGHDQASSDAAVYFELRHAGCRIQQAMFMRPSSGIEGEHPGRPGRLLSARPVFFIDTGIVIGAVLAEQFRQEIGHFAVRRQPQILE